MFILVDGSLCGKDTVIWVEFVGYNLDDVGVCNAGCMGCWWGRGDVTGVKTE